MGVEKIFLHLIQAQYTYMYTIFVYIRPALESEPLAQSP